MRRLGVDPRRLAALGVLVASLTGLVVWALVGDLLGAATPELDAVCSGLVFYAVMSAPRRISDARRVSQSKEAVFLASVSAASARVVPSRNRVVLMLRSGDAEISKALQSARKRLFLGESVDAALEKTASLLDSYSASNALRRLGLPSGTSESEGGEEAQGLQAAGYLASETKLPIFMTAAFFTPIMLLLYAVFSHFTEPQRFVELVALEIAILDIAFYLCS